MVRNKTIEFRMGFENVKGKLIILNDFRESVRGFRKVYLGLGEYILGRDWIVGIFDKCFYIMFVVESGFI